MVKVKTHKALPGLMAWVAQRVAHQTGNLEVVDSIPTSCQMFALTLKLLKYYILGYVASVW